MVHWYEIMAKVGFGLNWIWCLVWLGWL